MNCTWMPRAEKELLTVAEYVANEFGTSHALARWALKHRGSQ